MCNPTEFSMLLSSNPPATPPVVMGCVTEGVLIEMLVKLLTTIIPPPVRLNTNEEVDVL